MPTFLNENFKITFTNIKKLVRKILLRKLRKEKIFESFCKLVCILSATKQTRGAHPKR